jgi:hypothetical protein
VPAEAAVPRRATIRTVLLVLAASFVFGALIKTAFAVEYHTTGCTPHGWVAGASPSDGSFFSRTDGRSPCPQSGPACYIDSAGNPYPGSPIRGYASESADLCSAWSNDWFTATPTECHWRAEVGTYSLVLHVHVANNYCG